MIESLDIDPELETVTVVGNKGTRFNVLKRDAFISELLKVTFEGDKTATEIQIDVDDHIMGYIVDYMKKKKGGNDIVVNKPLKSTMIKSCHEDSRWEGEFIDNISLVKKDLHNLISASNYMMINPLLHLACAGISISLKGKSNQGIIAQLDINKI